MEVILPLEREESDFVASGDLRKIVESMPEEMRREGGEEVVKDDRPVWERAPTLYASSPKRFTDSDGNSFILAFQVTHREDVEPVKMAHLFMPINETSSFQCVAIICQSHLPSYSHLLEAELVYTNEWISIYRRSRDAKVIYDIVIQCEKDGDLLSHSSFQINPHVIFHESAVEPIELTEAPVYEHMHFFPRDMEYMKKIFCRPPTETTT